MGRLKTGASNEVLATEVFVFNKNGASWGCLTPLLGAKRVGLFVLEPISCSIAGRLKEASFEVTGFRNISNAIHSIGMGEWNYTLCLIQGRIDFVSDIVIQMRSVRPVISILGVETGGHSRISKGLLSHSAIQGFSMS